MDLSNQDKLEELVIAWEELMPKAEILPISAQNKFGVDYIMQRIIELLPVSPPYFGKDQWTDKPPRFFVSEIIREKILLYYDKEIHYSVEIVVEEYKESTQLINIQAVIYGERITKRNYHRERRKSKKVATEARKELERFFGKRFI